MWNAWFHCLGCIPVITPAKRSLPLIGPVWKCVYVCVLVHAVNSMQMMCCYYVVNISFIITLSPWVLENQRTIPLIIKCAWIHTVILHVSMQMLGSKNTGMNIHALLCAVLEQMWTLTCFLFPPVFPSSSFALCVFSINVNFLVYLYVAFYDITYLSLQ